MTTWFVLDGYVNHTRYNLWLNVDLSLCRFHVLHLLSVCVSNSFHVCICIVCRQPFEIEKSASELPVHGEVKQKGAGETCEKCESEAIEFCVTCQMRLCSSHNEVSVDKIQT